MPRGSTEMCAESAWTQSLKISPKLVINQERVDLSRPPPRDHEPVLRKGGESHTGGHHHGAQNFADVEALHASESRKFS